MTNQQNLNGLNGNGNSNSNSDQQQKQKHKPIVLITGCSEHSLGHALALAFHDAGFWVFATARNVDRMGGDLRNKSESDIVCLKMDVCDQGSIEECVGRVRELTSSSESSMSLQSETTGDGGRLDEQKEKGRLDILVNNAGGGMYLFCFCPLFYLPGISYCLAHCTHSIFNCIYILPVET